MRSSAESATVGVKKHLNSTTPQQYNYKYHATVVGVKNTSIVQHLNSTTTNIMLQWSFIMLIGLKMASGIVNTPPYTFLPQGDTHDDHAMIDHARHVARGRGAVLIRLTVSTVVVITGCSQPIKLNFYSTNIPGIARLIESCNIISTVSK